MCGERLSAWRGCCVRVRGPERLTTSTGFHLDPGCGSLDGPSLPCPGDACNGEEEDDFDDTSEDVVGPGLADDRDHDGGRVEQADDDVGDPVRLGGGEQGHDHHEARDEDVYRHECQ